MKRQSNRKLPYRKGVGALMLDAEGRVFVGRRLDTPGEAWQMPQGGIRKGEKPRRAVLRELAEEIGTDKAEIITRSARWLKYDLPPGLAGRVWGGRFRGQKQRWFVLRFTGTDADIDLDGSGHPEFSDWKWLPMEDLPLAIVPFKRRLYEDLVTEFRYVVPPPKAGVKPRGR